MMIEFWIVFCADPKTAVFKALDLNFSNMSHLAVIPLQHSSKPKVSSYFLNLFVAFFNFRPKVFSTFIPVCTWAGRSKYPHVFCLEIDWSKQHSPSMMSANPNIYWTQVSCNWTKHFAGNLSPGNVGLISMISSHIVQEFSSNWNEYFIHYQGNKIFFF